MVFRVISTSCIIVALSTLAVSAQAITPGEHCDRESWGATTPVAQDELLMCVRGTWRKLSELKKYLVEVEIRKEDGTVMTSTMSISQEGLPFAKGEHSERSAPVTTPGGGLSSVPVVSGYEFKLMVYPGAKSDSVRMEGTVEQTIQNKKSTQMVDTLLPFDTKVQFLAIDGLTYFAKINLVTDK